MNNFYVFFKTYKMNEFDIFNELALAGTLKEFHNPEKLQYVDHNLGQLYVDGFKPVQLKDIFYSKFDVSSDGTKLYASNRKTLELKIYTINEEKGEIKLTLFQHRVIPELQDSYGFKFIKDKIYFIRSGQKNIGIYDSSLNTVKIIAIDFGKYDVSEILVSNDNIVLPLCSRNQDFKSYEIILKNGTHQSVDGFEKNISYLSNDILYTYDNITKSLTYFNINNLDKKKTVKMGHEDVEKLLVSTKCTALICKSSLVIYYKRKVIVLHGEEYFRKPQYALKGSEYSFNRSVSLNKESNKIVFCVKNLLINIIGPIILYNLNTHQVERQLDVFGNSNFEGLELGFSDISEVKE
jgi:hypothetical protein